MAESEAMLLMIVDPESREAYRRGEGPTESGPLFFTTQERLEAFAQAEGIGEFAVHELPAGILARMKGKPHWVDGQRK